LGIPVQHEFVRTNSKSEQRKGRDTDIYEYDEISAEGDLIAKYIVRDSMSIYPAQSTTVSFVKYNSTGSEVDSGNL
ncbi:hypothetical protein, partial [Shewanella glacialipiscicola]|uniref:hypothetical protein n=1 Tax=Shewanella glacialipiscicola TaxID=614069 RepID=UPI001C814CF2